MKKTTAFIVLSLMTLGVFAQNLGIQFKHNSSLAELQEMAKNENKMIFMDCYTTWCGPCKHLSNNIFTLDEIGKMYNANFINCKFDMEKGEGMEIAKKYSIKAYPTLLFINAKGEVEHKKIGGGDKDDILQLASMAMDKENNLKAIGERIHNKTYSSADLRKYLSFNKYGDDNETILDLFYKQMTNTKLFSKDTWEVIEEHLNDFESDFGQFLIKNRLEYSKIMGKDVVDKKLANLFSSAIYKSKGDEEVMEKLSAIDKQLYESVRLQRELSMIYGKLRRNTSDTTLIEQFTAAAQSYAKNKQIDPNFINSIAWDIYQQVKNKKMSDKAIISTALTLSTKMLEAAPSNAMLLDTHAHVLLISGNKTEAITTQEKAIAILKANGDASVANYEKSLAEIKATL